MIYTDSYFIFKDRKSSDYGILVERQPNIISPERRIVTHTIPGRSGALSIEDGSYESYVKSVECAVLTTKYMNEISAWLKGTGEVIFSNEKPYKYRARIVNNIPFTEAVKAVGLIACRFIVMFDCQPFKYSVNAENHRITLREPGRFSGDGSVPADPVITVHGSGTVLLSVNGLVLQVSGIDGYITINSDVLHCYKNNTSQNHKVFMSFDKFPQLNPAGEFNDISWQGNVNRVEIEPNYRWV